MRGHLIVLEGTDGSGKSTQFAKLCRRLQEEGKPFHRLVFPRYENPSSTLIRMYLGGEFGHRPEDVNAYAASSFYAVDRYASWNQDWGKLYQRGELILADRYTTSNAVHQAGKVEDAERAEFFRWLGEFEYHKLGLPKPDLVLWLDMPTEKAVENLRHREQETHTQGDIHEVDEEYLRKCRRVAQEACQFYGWQRISCVTEDGPIRGIEEIHQEIWKKVQPFLK